MLQANLGLVSLQVKPVAGGYCVFDTFRRQWVTLQPEEWVRQKLLMYLVQQQKYPASLIAVERQLQVGERKRRFDAVVFNRQGMPWMLIECKAETVALDEKVQSQVLAYQSVVAASYIVLTNGAQHLGWQVGPQGLETLTQWPVLPF